MNKRGIPEAFKRAVLAFVPEEQRVQYSTQNILVAAKAHGLGACWVAGDNKEYADEICREVGAPKGYKLVSMISIGHPAEQPRKTKRPLHELVHWGKF
jgi:nitroreductase